MTNDEARITNGEDRGHLLTERRLPASAELDALPVEDVLRVINDEDAGVAAVVRAAIPAIAQVVQRVAAALPEGGRLLYFGAGTSGRLGVLDASECPPTFCSEPDQVVGVIAGGDAALRRSSEGAEDDPDGARAAIERLNVNSRDVVVGIAAGGTTPYVLGALSLARQRSAATALLCCVQLTPPPDHVDIVIALPVGPEVLTGSTRMKAGTATKMALNMITTAAMVRCGKAWGNLMVDLRASNAKLRDRAIRIIAGQTGSSREQAATLLDAAGGRVKVALVMARRNVDAGAAQRLLDTHHGQLRPILGPPVRSAMGESSHPCAAAKDGHGSED